MDNPERTPWRVPWKGIVLLFAVSVLVLTIIVWKMSNPLHVLQALRMYPLGYFFAALFFVLFAWLIDGQRIGMLTRSVGYQIPWWQLGIVLGAANFLTLVTPFAGGGGALVVYFLYKRGMKTSTATALVLIGGLAGQLSLASLTIIMVSIIKNVPADSVKYFNLIRIGAAAYIGILLTLLILLARSKRFFQWIFRKKGSSRPALWFDDFRATIRLILTEKRAYYVACIVTAFSYYVVYYTSSFTLLTGFGVYDPIFRYAIAVLFGIAPVFSPIPGGAGVAEGIAWLVLDNTLTPDLLGTFIILWRTAVFYIPILLGGTIFAFMATKWASEVILPGEADHTKE